MYLRVFDSSTLYNMHFGGIVLCWCTLGPKGMTADLCGQRLRPTQQIFFGILFILFFQLFRRSLSVYPRSERLTKGKIVHQLCFCSPQDACQDFPHWSAESRTNLAQRQKFQRARSFCLWSAIGLAPHWLSHPLIFLPALSMICPHVILDFVVSVAGDSPKNRGMVKIADRRSNSHLLSSKMPLLLLKRQFNGKSSAVW